MNGDVFVRKPEMAPGKLEPKRLHNYFQNVSHMYQNNSNYQYVLDVDAAGFSSSKRTTIFKNRTPLVLLKEVSCWLRIIRPRVWDFFLLVFCPRIIVLTVFLNNDSEDGLANPKSFLPMLAKFQNKFLTVSGNAYKMHWRSAISRISFYY